MPMKDDDKPYDGPWKDQWASGGQSEEPWEEAFSPEEPSEEPWEVSSQQEPDEPYERPWEHGWSPDGPTPARPPRTEIVIGCFSAPVVFLLWFTITSALIALINIPLNGAADVIWVWSLPASMILTLVSFYVVGLVKGLPVRASRGWEIFRG